eukprot:gene8273-9156_t
MAVQLAKPHMFKDVGLKLLKSDGSTTSDSLLKHTVEVSTKGQTNILAISNADFQGVLSKNVNFFKFGQHSLCIGFEQQPIILIFPNSEELKRLIDLLDVVTDKTDKKKSWFSQRTEESSAVQYFQFYAYLSQQQNMMQDYIRTSTYQRAILQNINDFKDKVVLDVGAGTGILSFFALQAGAKKVYSVEASSMAQHAATLAKHNNASDIIEVIAGKIEEIEIPEKIDAIISEPMGYMLFNERMLETYLHAKKWLKPGGKMFPTRGDLHIAPFTDDSLYMEHFGKSNFWCQNSFYGVDLTSLRHAATQEYFKQPIVDTFDVRILMAKPCTHHVDFLTTREEELIRINIPLEYTMLMTGTLHGLAFWFDVGFFGSSSSIWLSTAPQEPLTHWYQVRCLLPNPIFVRAGQRVGGNVLLVANERQSYDVEMEVTVEGTGVKATNILDLKNPFFRYTGVQTQSPPGHNNQSPTDAYWGTTGVVLNGGVNPNSVVGYGGSQVSSNYAAGGGLFAYSTQAVGNVMATGTGCFSNMSVPPVITARDGSPFGSSGSNQNIAGGHNYDYQHS